MPIASARATVGDLLLTARERLGKSSIEASPREATLLLAHASGLAQTEILARPARPLEAAVAERFERLVERRLTGEPVAYLIGRKEFFGREFEVDRRVLVPRPETEHVVETTLSLDLPPRARILDIGTGSGCLAVTLAAELTDARLTATDRSLGALAVADRNARRHGVRERVRLVGADLATALNLAAFDAVATNPPYIALADRESLPPDVRDFEPPEALFAPPGEITLLSRLLRQLEGLAPRTPVAIELGLGQAEPLGRHLPETSFDLLRLIPDYAGIDRVALLRRAAPSV